MFGQTFELRDLFIVGVLVVLEGVLSIDNALVLGLLAKRLPKFLQARALTYGLVGAFAFRILAIGLAGYLLHWEVPKLLGGLYLLWVAFKEFFLGEKPSQNSDALDTAAPPADAPDGPWRDGASPDVAIAAKPATDYRATRSTHTWAFWSTVAVIELTDVAFAVDSILAAVGTVPGREKLWIVVTGGMLGVILMRFAAVVFIRLLDRFPRFETSAYLLVAVIGAKLVLDYFFPKLDFHDARHAAFWLFWGSMLLCFCFGFIPQQRADNATK